MTISIEFHALWNAVEAVLRERFATVGDPFYAADDVLDQVSDVVTDGYNRTDAEAYDDLEEYLLEVLDGLMFFELEADTGVSCWESEQRRAFFENPEEAERAFWDVNTADYAARLLKNESFNALLEQAGALYMWQCARYLAIEVEDPQDWVADVIEHLQTV